MDEEYKSAGEPLDATEKTFIRDARGAINGLNAVDPDMAFMANGLLSNMGTTLGSIFGFNGENEQLKIQRTMDKAVQEHFMKDTVKQGNYVLEDINRQSGVLRGQLTDQAIANRDKYYGVSGFIQDSGIEGSRNMGRNLEYMKGRDAARTQLEYELMGAQADSVSRSTASRFDRLFRHGRPASGPSPTASAWPPVVSEWCNTVSGYFAVCC
jgi:hypothetical protein